MDLNMDIGKNLTELLSRLAEKIGTTADQVFPWYVKQQYIDGYCNLLLSVVISLLSGFFAFKFSKSAKYNEGNPNGTWFFTFVFICIFILSSVVLTTSFSDWITKINNPQYHAMQNLILDLQRLK